MKCYGCEKELTKNEKRYNVAIAETCCSGAGCGCRGLPMEPPFCFDCLDVKEKETIKMWEELSEVEKEKIVKKAKKYIKINDTLVENDKAKEILKNNTSYSYLVTTVEKELVDIVITHNR